MWRIVTLALVALLSLTAGDASAASCAKADFAQAVDRAGVALRQLNAEYTPRLQAKMRQLKQAKGWSDAGFEERAYAAVQDERTAALDAQANDLLAKLDTLGTFDPVGEADCAKLQELTATSLELQATVKAKATYTLAKIDQMLGAASAPPVPTEPKVPAPPAKSAAEPKSKAAEPAKEAAAAPPVQPKPPRAKETSGWSTNTKGEASRDVAIAEPPRNPPQPPAVVLAPSPTPSLVPPLASDEEGYSIDEIKAVSAGFFGKVSSGLGSVIEHVFASSGRPTGYVLGNEGGGAFLAGVRYGHGTLYMRAGGTQKIHWHGPSIGTDLGADGSKTLFLIYRLQSPDQLYTSFTGIDGSAFIVGGVGATLVTNGSVILAPIRSGVGLRLGANIGYIRFTPKSTWNPF